MIEKKGGKKPTPLFPIVLVPITVDYWRTLDWGKSFNNESTESELDNQLWQTERGTFV